MSTIILQGPALTLAAAEAIAQQLSAELETGPHYQRLHTTQDISADQVQALRAQHSFDINALPQDFDPSNVALLVTDMDSTLISIECIDEIADFVNVKPQVSEITESAMRGEIDFETSLRRRIALLKGLKEDALQHVYNERLQLNPGAAQMLAGLKTNNIKTALVSGGFTYFTDKLKARLDLDYTLANTLEFENGSLTGEIHGHIIGAQAKADLLLQKCEELNISAKQVVAMGDGANDLVMMKEAGLSIAYHAKPKVQAQAHAALNYCGLDGVLGLLNITSA